MDPEIGGDLLEGHTRGALTGDPDHVLTELFGIGLRHGNILSAHPAGQAKSDVTRSCSRPEDEDRASLPNVVDAPVAKSPSEGPRRRHRLTFTPSEATPVATTKTETPGVSLSCCR